MNFETVLNHALKHPQRGPGKDLPRPIMSGPFAVYVGCHFDNPSPVNPEGHPVWHLSISIHSVRRALYRNWNRTAKRASNSVAIGFLARVGDGKILRPQSIGTVAHWARRMTGREIDEALSHLQQVASGQ